MPVYEVNYTPSFYIIENTPTNVGVLNELITATEYLRLSASCLISTEDLTYQNGITNYSVPVLSQVSSKILINTNIPVAGLNNISLLYGYLSNFPTEDWVILNTRFLGGGN